MTQKNTLLVVGLITLFTASVNAAQPATESPELTKVLRPLEALQEQVKKIEADKQAGRITTIQAALELKKLKRLIEAATK